VDHLLRSLDACWCLRHPGNARSRHPVAARPQRQRRGNVHTRRSLAGRSQGAEPLARDIRPHGLRRPRDCGLERCTRSGTVSHRPKRFRRPVDLQPHRHVERLLPPPDGREMGLPKGEPPLRCYRCRDDVPLTLHSGTDPSNTKTASPSR